MKNDFTQGTPMEARQKEVDAFYEQGDKRDLELCRGRPLSPTAQAIFDLGVAALKQQKLDAEAEKFSEGRIHRNTRPDTKQ